MTLPFQFSLPLTMATAAEDTANFFHYPKYDEVYWDQYLAARPKYDACSFYDKIFHYHDGHSSSYHTAHDIATGPGQVARVLAARFQHVVASDPNAAHVDICRRRNASSASRITFLVASGEEVADNTTAASADAIFVGEAIALMDTEAAIAGFSRILKPKGTLAIWFYGRPIFADGQKDKCQAIYDKIVTRLFGRAIKGGGPEQTAGWKRATDSMASWFDNVAFTADAWEDVQRHKWNPHGRICFYDDEACDFPIEGTVRSEVPAKDEKVVEMVDETFWAESWDVGEVRRFIEVNLPSFREAHGEDPEVEAWYAELGEAMGGKDMKRKIAWPVVLLLASRK